MKELIIAPSVLSLDFSNPNAHLDGLTNSKAKWIHFDVMDGHFVPNITFGQDIMRGFKKRTQLFMDVHLMISDPIKYAPVFMDNGADMITFHYESLASKEECMHLIEMIKERNVQVGMTIKPGTDVHVLDEYLPLLDMVLIMSVEPGFGGQKFQPASLDKIKYLDEQRANRNLDFRIEIDGGINAETGKLAIEAGCDVLVAGSYIFKQDVVEGVDSLLCLK